MRVLDISLHVTPPILLLFLIVIFLRRGLNRQFPIFFVYIIYVPLATALRMSLMTTYGSYMWTYWSTEALYDILALLVLREVFHRVFALPYAAHRRFRLILPLTVLVISGVTIVEAIYHPFGQGYFTRLTSAIYWFDLGVHLLEGMILLLLVGLTLVFPIRWRQYEFGILAGFGLNASITMLAYLLRSEWGSRYEALFHYGLPLGYILATLIWLHAFLRPSDSPPSPQMGQDEMLNVVRRSRELLDKIEKGLGWRRGMAFPPV